MEGVLDLTSEIKIEIATLITLIKVANQKIFDFLLSVDIKLQSNWNLKCLSSLDQTIL